MMHKRGLGAAAAAENGPSKQQQQTGSPTGTTVIPRVLNGADTHKEAMKAWNNTSAQAQAPLHSSATLYSPTGVWLKQLQSQTC
jgi:hypothetical protein